MSTGESADRVVILNPVSGSGNHAKKVRRLAAERGFAVRETEAEGDAVRLAQEVADEATLVGACGGDGTLNAVVRGLRAAGALDRVTVGIVPVGTGNNFAANVGVQGIEHSFDVLEDGETRRIDLGLVEPPTGAGRSADDDHLFVNSCIGGLTADASSRTTSDAKARLGVVAYAIETLRAAAEFDGLPLSIESDGGEQWHGEALLLLVGNARRFPESGRTQANVEDGLFEVAVVEKRPAFDLAGATVRARLLGEDAVHLRRFRTPDLNVTVRGDATTFSLDGEMTTASELTLRTVEQVLSVRVGDAYEPTPD